MVGADPEPAVRSVEPIVASSAAPLLRAATPAPADGERSYAALALVVAVAVLVVATVGALVFRLPGPTAGRRATARVPTVVATQPPVTAAAPGSDLALLDPQVVVDDFTGPSSLTLRPILGAGSFTTGPGTWVTAKGRALLVTGDRRLPNLAFVDLGTADARVQARLTDPVQGAGLAFRVRDARNFWLWVSAPRYGTCILLQVVDGRVENRGNSGQVAMSHGLALGAHTVGADVELLVDGRVVLRVTDPDPRPGTGAGLAALAGTGPTGFDQLAMLRG